MTYFHQTSISLIMFSAKAFNSSPEVKNKQQKTVSSANNTNNIFHILYVIAIQTKNWGTLHIQSW